MSFGFGVGDFLAVSNTAKSVYEACKDGPREYKEISREAKSMRYAINSLSDDAQDPHSLLNKKGVRRKPELVEIIRNCETTMQELQAMIDKHSSLEDGHGKFTRVWDAYKVGSSDLDSLRGKLTFYTSTISMFLLSLEGSAVARIERKLDRICARILQDDAAQAQQSSLSVASTASLLSQIETNEDDVWTILKTELLAEEISMAHIMSNKEDIIEYIKSLAAEGLPNGAIEVNSAHIYGGIANSSASSASEPDMSDHVHVQSPSIVAIYERRRQSQRRRQRERQEWIASEERETWDLGERAAIFKRLRQQERSERQELREIRQRQRLAVEQEAGYQQEERDKEHAAVPQRREVGRRQRSGEQARTLQAQEDLERL